MGEVAAIILLAMEVNVEADEIEKTQIEIFGGRIVRVGEKAGGIGLLADVVELAQKIADCARPVPSRDVGANFVAEAIGQNRVAVLAEILDPRANGIANV